MNRILRCVYYLGFDIANCNFLSQHCSRYVHPTSEQAPDHMQQDTAPTNRKDVQ